MSTPPMNMLQIFTASLHFTGCLTPSLFPLVISSQLDCGMVFMKGTYLLSFQVVHSTFPWLVQMYCCTLSCFSIYFLSLISCGHFFLLVLAVLMQYSPSFSRSSARSTLVKKLSSTGGDRSLTTEAPSPCSVLPCAPDISRSYDRPQDTAKLSKTKCTSSLCFGICLYST